MTTDQPRDPVIAVATRPNDTNPQLLATSEMIDNLVSTDLPRRGVIDLLYSAAREHHGRPLTLAAAQLLHGAVRPRQVVLIATGWLDRPHVSTTVAETDGPPGAAVLARAVHIGLGAVPIVLVEAEIVDAVTHVVQAAGLRCLTVEQAVAAASSDAALHAAAVIPFPADPKLAAERATQLLDALDVAAFIAIEKGGQNEHGRIHTSRGDDTTAPLAKADALLGACASRGIPTIGIGDGGNEIGMGTVAARLRAELRHGERVVPSQPTDVLVAAAVSNWGGYGVAAALAAVLGRIDVLHTPELETAILQAACAAGLIDGVSGYVGPSADGLPLPAHRAIVTVLRTIIGDGVDMTAWPDPSATQ